MLNRYVNLIQKIYPIFGRGVVGRASPKSALNLETLKFKESKISEMFNIGGQLGACCHFGKRGGSVV